MMTHQQLAELEREVIANPHSHDPRLRFADACEQLGDADRAFYIRTQIDSVRRLRAWRRDWYGWPNAYSLLERYRDAWAGPIRERVRKYEYYAGFVECIHVDAAYFLDHAEELYALAPIRRLDLQNVAPVMEAVFQSVHLTRIVTLRIERQHLGDRLVEVLAASPHLGRLASLHLDLNDITDVGFEALGASNNLPALQYVNLYRNPAEIHSESVGEDNGHYVHWDNLTPLAASIEARYGRKPWLHAKRDRQRELFDDEF